MNVQSMAMSFPRKGKAVRWEHKHLFREITGNTLPRRKVHEKVPNTR